MAWIANLRIPRKVKGHRAAGNARRQEPDYHALSDAQYPGPDYHQVLSWIHSIVKPEVYLEIGVHRGSSLRLVQPPTRCLAIDPFPKPLRHPLGVPVEMYRMTSNEFFEKHPTPDLSVRLAFLDGLHLFEQVLLDLLNLEPHLTDESVVLVHDCLPLNSATASRKRETGFWSGDVWKLIPCLQRFRPDLMTAIVVTAPTGLGIITGFGSSPVQGRPDDTQMRREFIDQPFSYWEAFRAQFQNVLPNEEHAIRRHLSACTVVVADHAR